ncbi:hypothetical protein HOL21_04100 [Candidatus Woesearchaeota archaeon]|jgi:multidrug transporter EmrE-like cation transporter|nr:hypothetical protein [Candidatus Woesearchaeota archaeon]MBT5397368.1 hypothetical protein [Candidatus Woesearchaeota archaeon]MBT5924678.1 hypothetical protein [Candidatus Woesearchaeota archaeon]MBT6367787.1 hypothetical protein [Candidatus Woesearchaeota archaeon]MBT7762768.1 hypothetical protein [Candidatus Woesearchaeota archaeon]
MQTTQKAIILTILCTIFTSVGQILWKYGVIRIDFDHLITLLNIPFILGFVAYGLGAMFLLIAFKEGELSVLYPIVATSYVWVSILSPLLFPTDFMNPLKWAGVIIILISVSVLGLGNSHKKVAHHG